MHHGSPAVASDFKPAGTLIHTMDGSHYINKWDAGKDDLILLEKLSKHNIRLICEVAASKMAALKQSGYLTKTTADAMTKPEISRRNSEMEWIIVLKNTQLFSRTPENVLSSIAPIMKEVSYPEGQQIFAKGDHGDSMYIIYAGEV